MIQQITENALRKAIQGRKHDKLQEILAINDALTQLNGALRVAYTEAKTTKDWKAYKTLKSIKDNYENKLYLIEKEI